MPDRKSCDQGFSLIVLVQKVLLDIYAGAASALSANRDIRTVVNRYETRGINFLTTELPNFWKSVLSGIESGTYTRPTGFKRAGKFTVLPAFLQGKLRSIFHDDGSLLPEPDPYAIQEVCQVCTLFYKLERPYAPEKDREVVDNFINTEVALRELEIDESRTLDGARVLCDRVFSIFDAMDIRPHHGPGSVSTGERWNDKYAFKRKYSTIHAVYPYYTYFMAGGGREVADRVRWYKSLAPADYGRTKVILVPKDSRGPRLISSEPLEFQWIQGGLGDAITRHLESHPLTRGRVNFTDQTINQRLALESSLNRKYSTIDLKEASDRVSVDLVRFIFPERVFRALMACRSDATVLPDGREIGLTKYAPMGSALCFPVLATVVWAISASVAYQLTGRRDVYVYGDDLIVPTEIYTSIIEELPKFGLLVNVDKSFSKSNFRESCGVDAFNGVITTPVKLKKDWSNSPRNASSFSAYVAYMNAFFKKGLWSTADYLRKSLEKVYGSIPYGTPHASYPCIEVDDVHLADLLNKRIFKHRWNKALQRYEFRAWRPKPHVQRSIVLGWKRLLKDYSERGPINPELVTERRTVKNSRVWVATA